MTNNCPFCSLPPEINGTKHTVNREVFHDIDHLVLFYIGHFPHYWELKIVSDIRFKDLSVHDLSLNIPMHYCLYCGRKLDE